MKIIKWVVETDQYPSGRRTSLEHFVNPDDNNYTLCSVPIPRHDRNMLEEWEDNENLPTCRVCSLLVRME